MLFVITPLGTPAPFSPHRHIADINLTYASPGRSLTLQIRPSAQLILENKFSIDVTLLHDDKLAVVDVAEVFEILDGEVIPFHQKDAGHEAVSDENAYGGEIRFVKATPEGVIEA